MRLIACLLLSILCVRAHAGDVAHVEAVLAGEAVAIDLAEAKLAIDVAIDSRVDSAMVRGELDDKARERMMQIADRCPVHRTLTSQIRIVTRAG